MMTRDQALHEVYQRGAALRPQVCEGEDVNQLWETELRSGEWHAVLQPGVRAPFGMGEEDCGPLDHYAARLAWEAGVSALPEDCLRV